MTVQTHDHLLHGPRPRAQLHNLRIGGIKGQIPDVNRPRVRQGRDLVFIRREELPIDVNLLGIRGLVVPERRARAQAPGLRERGGVGRGGGVDLHLGVRAVEGWRRCARRPRGGERRAAKQSKVRRLRMGAADELDAQHYR